MNINFSEGEGLLHPPSLIISTCIAVLKLRVKELERPLRRIKEFSW
jgi:hypothetical protein